jgi:hypothetical protein
MNRRIWSLSAKELRDLLLVLAIVTWALLAHNTCAAGPNYRTGQLKGGDFLHFYVMGNMAAEGRGDLLYDAQAQRAEQERLVPASQGIWYPPINGPQMAVLFAGFATLPYLWAAIVWAVLTMLLYAACVWAVWRECPSLRAHTRVVTLAALGFPPFYALLLCGQTSALTLVCVTLAYLALRADRKWWAGVALGSLIIKPHLGPAVAVVMLVRREWRVIGGALAAIGVQWGVSALVLGVGPLLAYFQMLRLGPGLASLLEPTPSQMHSLRPFWELLLPQFSIALAFYLVTSAMVLALTVRLWRTSVPLGIRYSGLILATLLVSPHVGVYELVLLAPAFILTASESERSADALRRTFRVVLSLAYLVPVFGGLAAITHVQLSIPVFAAWFAALHWAAFRLVNHSGTAEPTGA